MGNSAMQTAAKIMLPFYVTMTFVGMVWYYRRRTFYPIPPRDFFLAFGTQVLMWVGAILCGVWMILDFNVPCLLYEFWFFINFMCVTALFIPRVIHLLFRYHMNQMSKLFNSREQGESEAKPKSRMTEFIWRHRHWVSPPYLKRIFVMGASGALPVCVIFWAVNNHITWETSANDSICPLFTTGFTTVLIASGPLGVGGMAFVLKDVEEGLHIKEELVGACGICLPLVTLTITPVNQRHYDEMMLLWHVFVWGMALVSYYPVYLTYRYTRPSERTLATRSLRDLLSTKHGFDQFRDHLAREFAVENLYFWRELRDLQDAVTVFSDEPLSSPSKSTTEKEFTDFGEASPTAALELRSLAVPALDVASTSGKLKQSINPIQLREILLRLQSEYVGDRAPNSINISYRLRLDLSDAIDSVLTSMDSSSTTGEVFQLDKLPKAFEEAEKEVITVMESDSFIRFKQSQLPGAGDRSP